MKQSSGGGESFMLPCGIDLPNTEGLKNAYEEQEGGFEALISADRLADFLTDYTALIPEPIFFFLELPESGSAESEDYRLYYLDNCTRPVIKTLIKEYGSLLVGDGVCRFGFGGNESGDEIYVKLCKVMSIYCPNAERMSKARKLFARYGMERTERLLTPWELATESTPMICVRAEEDGISLFDLPEMLKAAGMYEAESK